MQMRVGECEQRWGSNGSSSSNSGSPLPLSLFYFIYLVFLLSNYNFYNFYTTGMCDTMGFVRHCANTGMVFAGTGTVWKIPTHSIPMTNPTGRQSKDLIKHLNSINGFHIYGVIAQRFDYAHLQC